MVRPLSLLLATGLFAASALAQAPYLVRDLNATTPNAGISSTPSGMTLVNGRVVLIAATPDAGRELRVMENGKVSLLRDIVPGPASSSPVFIGTDGQGTAYFTTTLEAQSAFDKDVQLWRTDGTAAGTWQVPLAQRSSALTGVLRGSTFFYASSTVQSGTTYFATDGVTSETRTLGVRGSFKTALQTSNRVYFFAEDGNLLVSDGTANSLTALLPQGASHADAGVAVGTTLYFLAKTQQSGRELWKTNGTVAGTAMVLDQFAGEGHGVAAGSIATDGTNIYFVGKSGSDWALFKTDGTAAGTQLVKVLGSTQPFSVSLSYSNGLIYVRYEGQLWRSDGNAAGTFVLASTSGDALFQPALGGLIFNAGNALWATDGTLAGTRQLASFTAPPAFASAIGNTLYFAGTDAARGSELWTSDGTPAGTQLLADIAGWLIPSSDPHELRVSGSLAYFLGSDDSGVTKLFRTDGTSAGTYAVAPASGGVVSSLTPFGGFLYFRDGSYIHRTDGTHGGTGATSAGGTPLLGAGSYLFYNDGAGLARTGGNAATTAAVNATEERGVTVVHAPQALASIGEDIYFFGSTQQNGPGLFWSSGSMAVHPTVAKRITRGAFGTQTTIAGGSIFFTSATVANGEELWRSDGTAHGTKLLRDIRPGLESSSPAGLTAVGARLFFTARDAEHGLELWTSDGTEEGTRLVKDIVAGPSGASVGNLTAAGSILYFTANDGVHGNELWRSDGTEAGTVLVGDIAPGEPSSSPTALAYAYGTLWFTANDGLRGAELWRTTAIGVELAGDLAGGAASSDPGPKVATLSNLYFAATTATGRELWAMPLQLGDAPAISISDARVTEGNNAVFVLVRSGATAGTSTVAYTMAGGTATAGSDFVASSGTVTFGPSDTMQFIQVPVTGDNIREANEGFTVLLGATSNAILARNAGYAMIEDDDRRADLTIEWVPVTTMGNGSIARRVRITNHGPDLATDLRFTYSESPHRVNLYVPVCVPANANPIPCRLNDLAAGESREIALEPQFTFTGAYTDPQRTVGQSVSVDVAAAETDPNPTDNRVDVLLRPNGPIESIAVPQGLVRGTPGTAIVVVTAAGVPRTIRLLASDPAVSITPATIELPAQQQVARFTVTAGAAPATRFASRSKG